MSAVPRFAVVGHPNKGKSSIVATLAEDETVKISPQPGTTRDARLYPMRVDGEVLYELIDTPGFQRAREALEWLTEHASGAASRPDVVRRFVEEHATDPRFRDECALLRPVLDGAGILYVVDGAHPYGREYEAEMEVLRWTGQPRMALINLIGDGRFIDEWRRALDQYFSLVRVFDAMRADFPRRIDLLRAFGELREDWAAPLRRATDAITADRRRRRERSAAEIVDLLSDALRARESAPLERDEPDPALERALEQKLRARIEQRERASRRIVQQIYHHDRVVAREPEPELLTEGLFSERSFNVFGLSSAQLAITGAASGAVAGGGIDLLLGGASLLLGAGVGALIGGVGALLGAHRLAQTQVLGQPLGGYRLTVGPINNPNLPWVLLGRARLHHRLIAERNHARREELMIDAGLVTHTADAIEISKRRTLAAAFAKLRGDGLAADERRAVVGELAGLLDVD
jgi:hypothetical protein